MKKKMILNLCMVLTILLVAACGVMTVGSVKGWFDKDISTSEGPAWAIAEKTGIAMIERSGIAYEVGEGMPLREGDVLYTKTAASLQIAEEKQNRIHLDGNARIEMTGINEGVEIVVHKGDALVDSREFDAIVAVTGDTKVTLDQAVASVSTQASTGMVYVYGGSARLYMAEQEVKASAGEVVTIAANLGKPEVTTLTANSLSDSQMTKIIKAGIDDTFCFTQDDLELVRLEREEEKQRAQEELLAQKEAEKKAKRETVTKKQVTETETIVAPPVDATEEEVDEGSLTCTIEIRCDTILSNMENLEEGKEGYVPESGTILGTTAVSFEEGETVFEVLQRVCDSVGIQLEYSWTPLYDSYYIEGINHLYEFDCGSESGWMYKVNGWFPNYGCSSYDLQDGDTIVWCYTCNGLGADVGGPVY